MKKGQSIVVQFLLFFLIGFSVFISLGSFFNYQSEILKQSILSSGMNLTATQISSAIITVVDSCKECDFVNFTIRTHNTSAGYNMVIKIEDSILKVLTPLQSLSTPAHNILSEIKTTGKSFSDRPIILTFNRTNNSLEVS